MLNRRDFLQQSAALAAGTLMIPSFLRGNVLPSGKRLVVIQLSGGNDGLNTVIPFHNDIYYRERPSLAGMNQEILKLTDDVALNGKMRGLKTLYDHGELCIINNVGYPDPNRSHFRSMDIWQSGSGASEYLSTGWLGRYFDDQYSGGELITGIDADGILNLALKGSAHKGITVNNIWQLYNSTRNLSLEHHTHDHPMADFLYRSAVEIQSSAEYLFSTTKTYKSHIEYPKNRLSNQLKMIGRMICSGVESPVYYVSLGGFDTHVNQRNRQDKLLEIYSAALKAFRDELKSKNEWKNTIVMTFSEFGRRVKENASKGTDHGKANNLFIAGGNLKSAGLYNEMADLSNLDNGDIQYKIDFRQVYATILDNWLLSDSTRILRKSFDKLKFI